MEAKVTFAPRVWDESAEEQLAQTFHDDFGRRRMARGVNRGDYQLWAAAVNMEPAGMLVTEKLPGEIFVWCYEGRDFFTVSRALAKFAVFNGMGTVGWFTFHKGAARRYRKFAPQIETTGIPGEMRFRLSAERLAYGT